MRRPTSIPHTTALPKEVRDVVDPLKENMEWIVGQRGPTLQRLGPSATLAQVIDAYNELLDKLQGPV